MLNNSLVFELILSTSTSIGCINYSVIHNRSIHNKNNYSNSGRSYLNPTYIKQYIYGKYILPKKISYNYNSKATKEAPEM